MKTNKILITVVILIASFTAKAQLDSTKANWRLFPAKQEVLKNIKLINNKELNYNNPSGTINITEDSQIKSLNTKISDSPFIYGYTLQLSVSQSKSTIQNARYKILKSHPSIELEAPYKEPNIYLYAGRFYDRASAYAFKNEISSKFPNSIVIGPKKMNLPNIKMPEETQTNLDNN